jgi:dCMP deaminase
MFMEQLTIEQQLLKEAYVIAQNSPDLSTQNGAYLLNPNQKVIGLGCNTLPRGVQILPDRLERPVKYEFTEHAERNCIYDAARKGFSTDGATMVVCWAACTDCARAIIQAGIRRVITHKRMYDESSPRWVESISNALTMMEEAGVEFELIDGELGAEPIRFNERLWTP